MATAQSSPAVLAPHVPFKDSLLASEMEIACGMAGVTLTAEDRASGAKVHSGEMTFDEARAEARAYFASL